MGIGDSITLVSCLAGLMLALPALLIFLNLIFARTTDHAAFRLQKGYILPFFAGLISAIAIGVPGAILLSLGSVFQFCGTLVYMAILLWAFLGLSSVSRVLGMRLGEYSNRPENPLLEASSGAFVLTLAIAFPIIGWFMVLPFALIIGAGAVFLGRVNRFRGKTPDFDETLVAAS